MEVVGAGAGDGDVVEFGSFSYASTDAPTRGAAASLGERARRRCGGSRATTATRTTACPACAATPRARGRPRARHPFFLRRLNVAAAVAALSAKLIATHAPR